MHLRGAEMGAWPSYVSISATKKMGKKTRKMGYSLTEIALAAKCSVYRESSQRCGNIRMATIRVFVRGKGEVQLSDEHDYVADGGEGRIYAQGDVVYKIYLDRSNMIPEAKIAELSELDRPNIIRPKDILLNEKNHVVGFTMDRVDGTELCRLFNTIFLKSNNVRPDMLLKLVENMQETTQFIHDKECLVVDGNEMNYLVDHGDYALPFFIDVNSYQTRNFPASAINIVFADPHAKTFSALSDWFTFAIVACKLFVGIHPYKGKHPNYGKRDLLKRMKDNISIFNPETSIPLAARDFSHIPTAYYEWFVKLFEKGERLLPPGVAGLLKVVQVTAELVQSTGNFAIKLLRKYDREILKHSAVHGKHVVVTQNALYVDRTRHDLKQFRGEVVFTPKTLSPLIAGIREKDGMLAISDMNGNALDLTLKVSRKPFVVDNTIYAVHRGDLTEVAIHEINKRAVASVSNVWKIMPKSSVLFDGLIYQSVLGKSYLVIPYHRTGKSYCAIQAVPELDEYRIVDGKHDQRVCMLIGYNDDTYHRIIVRFDETYQTYDVRVIEDIDYPMINFVTLDNGIVVSIDEHTLVEVFSNRVGSSKVKRIDDPDIKQEMILSKDGTTVLFYTGNKLYSLKMTS